MLLVMVPDNKNDALILPKGKLYFLQKENATQADVGVV